MFRIIKNNQKSNAREACLQADPHKNSNNKHAFCPEILRATSLPEKEHILCFRDNPHFFKEVPVKAVSLLAKAVSLEVTHQKNTSANPQGGSFLSFPLFVFFRGFALFFKGVLGCLVTGLILSLIHLGR